MEREQVEKHIEEILKSLGLKCTLGCGLYANNFYYAMVYTRPQMKKWMNKLTEAGYQDVRGTHEQYAYLVLFKDK